MKQYISFSPSAGICNRIKKLFSALRFNANIEDAIDLYWSIGELTDKKFSDLFLFDLVKFNEISCTKKVELENAYDIGKDMSWRLKIEDGEVPKGFTQAYLKDEADKEYIDFEYERIPLNCRKEYLKFFEALRPSSAVEKRINEVNLSSNCIAVHVREDKYWVEYGRGKSNTLNNFISMMKQYDENTKFFLASADEKFSVNLKKYFEGRIIELPNKSYKESVDAVAELYLLSKCKEMIGTYGSTFSEVAWWLSGCSQKVRIVGRIEDWGIKCPVCDSVSTQIKSYKKSEIINSYQHLYDDVPENLDVGDYEIYQCPECKLVFSNPMRGGSQNFYSWVTSHANYYPTKDTPRWEWKEICDYLKQKSSKRLLEVGCGVGDFLEYLKENTGIEGIGLDTTVSSYNKCLEKGLEVYNYPLEEYVTKLNIKFDYVVAFHLLEHVDNPLEVVKCMMNCLNEDGICMLSFPYSDDRVLKCFTTANNMPPHHLTRWNFTAIKKLAEEVGAELELVGPDSSTIKVDILSDLRNEYFKIYQNDSISQTEILKQSLINYKRSADIIYSQCTREKIKLSSHIEEASILRRPPWFVLCILRKKKG